MDLPRDNNGWSTVPPGLPCLFVSTSGDNANDGSQSKPLLSLKRAIELVKKRTSSTAVLLASGASFNESVTFGGVPVPLLIGAYTAPGSSGRPKLVGDGTAVSFNNIGAVDLTLLDLEITQARGDLRRLDGVRSMNTQTFWMEGCDVHHVAYGFNIGGNQGSGVGSATVRRNVIHDIFGEGARAQGGYANWTGKLLVEENVFYKCGWIEGQKWSPANTVQENHVLYLAETIQDCTIRRNIIARANSHGLQMRCGGLCEENLFYCNPIHGFGQDDSHTCQRNVFYGSALLGQGTADPSFNATRGWGWEIGSYKGYVLDNRFIAIPNVAVKVEKIERLTTQPPVPPSIASIRDNVMSSVGEPVHVYTPREQMDQTNNLVVNPDELALNMPTEEFHITQHLKFWRDTGNLFNPGSIAGELRADYNVSPLKAKLIDLQAKYDALNTSFLTATTQVTKLTDRQRQTADQFDALTKQLRQPI